MPTQTKEAGIVQVVAPTAGTHDGELFSLKRGELFAADHPIVKAHPEAFGPPDIQRGPRPEVEQATAAPGEKRGRPRPRG